MQSYQPKYVGLTASYRPPPLLQRLSSFIYQREMCVLYSKQHFCSVRHYVFVDFAHQQPNQVHPTPSPVWRISYRMPTDGAATLCTHIEIENLIFIWEAKLRTIGREKSAL